MDLHLAANYDVELIEELAASSVTGVYGKQRNDFVGGGRAGYMGRRIELDELSKYIDKLKEKKLEFSYLLNSSCLGNREWNRRGQKKIENLLDRLLEAGVEAVTVSTPYLFKLIKKRYPQLKITVGIYAQVDTVERVKFWDELGAAAITLESFSINRNFERLKKIRAATEKELILIANHLCLPNCPLQPYHQNCFSHGSDNESNFFVDYCYLECNRRRFADPAQFIKAQWIRPADINKYEAIGYDTFKLLERDLPSPVLEKRVRAYETEEYSGNLADLFLSHSFGRQENTVGLWDYLKQLFQVPVKSLFGAREFMREQGLLHELDQPPVKIRSEEIPANFLARVAGKDCLNTSCEQCGLCREVAARAVEVPEETAAKYAEIIERLESGEFWNV